VRGGRNCSGDSGVQLGVDECLEARDKFVPKLTAAILFFCTGASIGCAFLRLPQGPAFGSLSIWDRPVQVAAGVSPLAFLCACVLVFVRPLFGYGLGVTAGLIALPWFVRAELALSPWNSWIYLNYESPAHSDQPLFLTFTNLRILSVALIVMSVACASLRLLPARWSMRKTPLCQRTWPAFAAGALLTAAWFVHSATPYSLPIFHDRSGLEFRILHVRKHGLHFQEVVVDEFRNGRAYVLRNDRRLFQYRFERRVGTISLWEASQAAYQQARAFAESPELWKLHTPPPKALRSWNAEGWYVVLKDSRVLTFTTEYRTSPPGQVTELFHEIESLPASEERSFGVRDVCLGFCYDPVAALGFSVLNHRAQLLSASGYGSGF
jgi:hypothetical protein